MKITKQVVNILIITAFFLYVPFQDLKSQWIVNGTPICTADGTQSWSELVSDCKGGAIITWQDNRNGDYDIYAQRISNEGQILWMPDGIPVCVVPGDQCDPRIVTDDSSGAYIVWRDGRSGSNDIYIQRIDSLGNGYGIDNGLGISLSSKDHIHPQIISDGQGGYIVTYMEINWVDEYFIDEYLYAARIDCNLNTLWNVAICTDDWERQMPALICDGEGGAFFAWWNLPIGHNTSIIRVDNDGDISWPAKIIADPGSTPVLIGDGVGGAVIVVESEVAGVWGLEAMRIDAGGNFIWNPNRVNLNACHLYGIGYFDQVITSNGNGKVITAWVDGRNTDWDIYAQCIDTSGTFVWDTVGVPICTSQGEQRCPSITHDGQGGAIITWRGDGIYAQRIDSLGNILWEENGVAICDIPVGNAFPKVAISDDIAIITWADYRGGEGDIYAAGLNYQGDVIVATLLRSYNAYHNFDDIVVEWILNELREDLGFLIYRSENSGEYELIRYPAIFHDGARYSFRDSEICAGSTYRYRVVCSDHDEYSILFETYTIVTQPNALSLYQNYPNPFNASTTIKFYLPYPSHVTLDIYNSAGMRITRLLDCIKDKGEHIVRWNGRGLLGNEVDSGIYIYELHAGKKSHSGKMILIK